MRLWPNLLSPTSPLESPSSQDTIVVHDPAYLDTLEASTGKGLPSFDVQRFAEYHKHASHHPSPLRPIQVRKGRGEKKGGEIEGQRLDWGVHHKHVSHQPNQPAQLPPAVGLQVMKSTLMFPFHYASTLTCGTLLPSYQRVHMIDHDLRSQGTPPLPSPPPPSPAPLTRFSPGPSSPYPLY